MNHLIKLILLMTFFLLVTQSCVIEPKLPSVNLIVNNHTLFKIDSLCVFSDSTFNKDNSECYSSNDFTNQIEAFTFRKDSSFRIKIRFDNSLIFISDKQIRETNNYDGFVIDINDYGLKITKTNSFLIKHYILLFIYITILNILFKALIYVYVTKPIKKWLYLTKYIFICDLTTITIYIINEFLIPKNGLGPILIIPLGLILSLTSDFIYHRFDNSITNKKNTLLFVITNLLYITIGLIIGLMFYTFVIDK